MRGRIMAGCHLIASTSGMLALVDRKKTAIYEIVADLKGDA